jgi:glycosyltransferase involved in cell wall biosynthesis
MKPKLSIVIPTFNSLASLKKCLSSLCNQTLNKEDFEVIVVDDGSTDGTLRYLKQISSTIGINFRYASQSHKCPAEARNLGVKISRANIIAFIDADCIAKENWGEEILKEFEEITEIVGIEGKTIADEKVNPFSFGVVSEEGGGYYTCNIAYKREVLEKVKGFDKEFKSQEDLDLAWRILKYGKIKFSPNVIVIHPTYIPTLNQRVKKLYRLYWEFKLYKKHPEKYNQERKKGIPKFLRKLKLTPIRVIILSVIIGEFFHKLKLWRKKVPLTTLIKFICVLLLERIAIFLFLPLFIIKNWEKESL